MVLFENKYTMHYDYRGCVMYDYQLPLFAVSVTIHYHYLQSVWLPITTYKEERKKKSKKLGKKAKLRPKSYTVL